MAKIKGMDISYWQGTVDFKKVAADGIKFAVLREGYRKTIDGKFLDYVKGCQQNGIYVMAYHFIYTDNATTKQNAQSTYDNIKKAGLDPTNTWIAADLEYDTWTKNGEKCTKAKCTQYTKEYLDALKALGCNKLFIYTNNDYYKNYYDWSQLKYPIWLADYSGDLDHNCVMQQYSSSGKVNGISGNVDMDWLFDESMMTGTNATTPTQETAKEETQKMIEVTAERVIAVARAEVGYKEKASNSQLDDKTANAGSANYTKYARDFDKNYPNWYNGKKNGYAWCDMFVDWCFLTAFGYKKALELLCQPEKSAGAGCTYSYNYYKNKGQVGTAPKIGAQIFFGTPGDFSHTGLVYDFDNSYVYTIEGNTSDQVAYRKYSRSKSNIYYGYPNYSGTVSESVVGTDIPTSTDDGSLRQGMTGSAVETMQKMLIKLGYSCGSSGADGDFGKNTLAAVKKFQEENGLTVDGVYGPKTKAKLTELYNAATATKPAETTTKSTDEIAKEVIDGKWGNGDERKKKLEAAGYNYRTIQDKVNELVGGGTKTTTSTQTNTTVKVDYAKSFSKSIAKTYTVTGNLNLRAGASTSKAIITVIPKGDKVTCYGYYTGDWYYVKYGKYTGFCSKQYLK